MLYTLSLLIPNVHNVLLPFLRAIVSSQIVHEILTLCGEWTMKVLHDCHRTQGSQLTTQGLEGYNSSNTSVSNNAMNAFFLGLESLKDWRGTITNSMVHDGA